MPVLPEAIRRRRLTRSIRPKRATVDARRGIGTGTRDCPFVVTGRRAIRTSQTSLEHRDRGILADEGNDTHSEQEREFAAATTVFDQVQARDHRLTNAVTHW